MAEGTRYEVPFFSVISRSLSLQEGAYRKEVYPKRHIVLHTNAGSSALGADLREEDAISPRHDGTNTQHTKKQIEALEHLKSPVVSMNMITPIISNQKAVLMADRPKGRVMPRRGRVRQVLGT